MRENDVLVEVRAIGVNPGEAFIRSVRGAEPGGRVLLGWEFSGVVTKTGPAAQRFKAGDRVFWHRRHDARRMLGRARCR